MDRNRGGVDAVGGVFVRATDTFNRPADTNNYASNDVVAATVSDTATTPLRGLTLARIAGGEGYLTSFRVTTNNSSWVAGFRVDLYTVAAPTTALTGDNVASAPKFANDGQFVGSFQIPTMTTPTGSDLRMGIKDDLRIPFKCAAADTKLYYRLVLLAAETNEASGQTFNITAIADIN